MAGKIFLLSKDESLSEVEEAEYPAEAVLQELLAKHPSLLGGHEMTPKEPRRWLLVSREMGVPDAEDTGNRWSLDHLFIDQDGTPTFVECKRSSDTRGRREVVAQMLDYAANGVRYWSVDSIRQKASETSQDAGRTLDEDVLNLIESKNPEEVEIFWNTFQRKLQSGEVRLVFVADEIPPELKRLVEFLNEQMQRVEVLALEVKHYVGLNQKVLVPRLVGRTETAIIQREQGTSSGWRRMERGRFLECHKPAAVRLFEMLLDEGARRGHEVSWSGKSFSLRAQAPGRSQKWTFLTGYTDNDLMFYFDKGAPWSEGEGAAAIRRTLLQTGLFREGGLLTLKYQVDEKSADRLREFAPKIFELVEASISRVRNPDQEGKG